MYKLPPSATPKCGCSWCGLFWSSCLDREHRRPYLQLGKILRFRWWLIEVRKQEQDFYRQQLQQVNEVYKKVVA